jgi:hypothetical protein
MSYDSAVDTQAHINRVRALLHEAIGNFRRRAEVHDQSKLIDPEKAIFDVVTPKLKALTYGSDEYKASLAEMGPALQHHYQHNTHHPEHYESGVNGMDLFDLLEMLIDWKAATERHADGSITRSLDINKDRFSLSDQTLSLLANTVRSFGWDT